MSQKKRKYQDNYLGFWICKSYSGWSTILSVCPVHEKIFKQYHETCSAETTPSKCSSKYDKQKPVLF